MRRCVVNVATGSYVRGQERLTEKLASMGVDYVHFRDRLPAGSPSHRDVPYAFKAYALEAAMLQGYTTLLWADACILPVKPLDELFERIERDGYWIGNNGWTNYEWTADSAYPDLFPGEWNLAHSGNKHMTAERCLEDLRILNRKIPHVVATTFGVSLNQPRGKAILGYYLTLAKTKAFCGPWQNANYLGDGWPYAENPPRLMPCGPADVRGHRHDQTALSVTAWRMGCDLTNSPDIFAYQGGETDKTILVADARY